MATSSYDKVSALYCETEDWKFYQSTVQKRLQTLRLSTASFEIREDALNPRPYFRYKFDGAVKEDSLWRNDRADIPTFQVDWDYVNPPGELEQLARYVWSQKKVPTYFCKLERNEKGPKEQNWLIRHFRDYARDRLTKALASEYDEAGSRIRRQIIEFYDAPDFAARRSAAVEQKAFEEIRAALMRFRHLDESVLRRAYQQFLVEDVLTC